MTFSSYFLNSEKRKSQEMFRKLKQGDHLVQEYEQEFSHIINYILYVMRDNKDKTDFFERRLLPEIFKVVHAFKLQTFAEVLDRALGVELGNVVAREERESYNLDRGMRRSSSGSGSQSSSRRSPRHL